MFLKDAAFQVAQVAQDWGISSRTATKSRRKPWVILVHHGSPETPRTEYFGPWIRRLKKTPQLALFLKPPPWEQKKPRGAGNVVHLAASVV